MSDITDKIGALLNKADSTDNEHERDAYVAKAQALATTYAVDLELARTRQRNKEAREVPEVRQIQIGERGQVGNALACSLFMAIGEANDLKFNIAHNSTYLIAFGFPSDIDVTERLYASLIVQRQRACDAAIKAGEHKLQENLHYREASYGNWRNDYAYKPGEYVANAKAFRSSFYEGFNRTLGTRLKVAKAEALDAIKVEATETEVATTGALVLVGKREAVSSFYSEKSTARGSWRGGSRRSHISGASNAGSKAAQNANIHGTQGSLPGGRRALA